MQEKKRYKNDQEPLVDGFKIESDRSFVSEIGISAKFYNIGYRRVQITDNRLNDRLTNADNHKRLAAHAMIQRQTTDML